MNQDAPFKYFKTSPEVIRLAVMYYVRYPLSYRQVEDIFTNVQTNRDVPRLMIRPLVWLVTHTEFAE